MKTNYIFILLAVMSGCTTSVKDSVLPPSAKKVSREFVNHGIKRVDNYYWMRERDSKDVLEYLKSENTYREEVFGYTKPFEDSLFQEMKKRIKEDDESVPLFQEGYYYIERYITNGEYPIYVRKKGSIDAPDELLLDGNKRGDGKSFYDIGELDVSLNQKILAYAEDTIGRRFYDIYFKDLETNEEIQDCIPHTTGNFVWLNDNKTIIYTKQDPNTLRSYEVYAHTIGTSFEKDRKIFGEGDETFNVFVDKSKSSQYIFIHSESTLTDDVFVIPADVKNEEMMIPQLIARRDVGHKYSVEHFGEYFYILTNSDSALNYRLVRVPIKNLTAPWEEIISHRKDCLLEDIEVFRDYFVLSEKKDGLSKLRVKSWDGKEDYYIETSDPAYNISISDNVEINTSVLRYEYTSLTTPYTVYDIDLKTKKEEIKKRSHVLGSFKPEDYVSERIYVNARDGVKIPMSIVYKKGIKKDNSNPALIYGYGAYGIATEPSFSSKRLSLLERGFIFAIAHIRGGEDLGRQWYEDGKLLKKKNTFYDFIDCSEYLVNNGFTNPEKLFAMGGSAGGLLMGAVMNMRPDLYKGIIAAVPFVDVINTMLDETIPLTTSEYDEWGNPKTKEYFEYMLSYSPYDQVEAKNYPNLLVITGYHDSQVQYWEPAKWVAKLRNMKTNNNMILFYTNMDSGHGGASGRFESLKETAMTYTFLIKLAENKPQKTL
ncbi:MAG: S9 family peptidase [Chitinophagaceae bacterium]|nr:S9 family peptidase [Chitinophagaceae bacterium]